MLTLGEDFGSEKENATVGEWGDRVFRYCTFKGIKIDGGHIDSVFLSCEFHEMYWYWSFFNQALFINTSFTACRFGGVSFADCVFVECEFDHCSLEKNNLGGDCKADNTKFYGCRFDECVGFESLMTSA